MDDSAEILFQSFSQEALESRSGMGREVRSFKLSVQHHLCRPRRHQPSKVLEEAIVACHMPGPYEFPSHDRLQALKGKPLELYVLNEWDFNFCVRSSPLWG